MFCSERKLIEGPIAQWLEQRFRKQRRHPLDPIIVNSSYLMHHFDKISDLRAFSSWNIFKGYSANSDGLSCVVDRVSFEDWFRKKGLRRNHEMDMLRYAKKYCGIFFSGRLGAVEGSGKLHALQTLSNLSEFLGCHKWFKEMREESGLK